VTLPVAYVAAMIRLPAGGSLEPAASSPLRNSHLLTCDVHHPSFSSTDKDAVGRTVGVVAHRADVAGPLGDWVAAPGAGAPSLAAACRGSIWLGPPQGGFRRPPGVPPSRVW